MPGPVYRYYRFLSNLVKCSFGFCLVAVGLAILVPASIIATIGWQQLRRDAKTNATEVADILGALGVNATETEIFAHKNERRSLEFQRRLYQAATSAAGVALGVAALLLCSGCCLMRRASSSAETIDRKESKSKTRAEENEDDVDNGAAFRTATPPRRSRAPSGDSFANIKWQQPPSGYVPVSAFAGHQPRIGTPPRSRAGSGAGSRPSSRPSSVVLPSSRPASRPTSISGSIAGSRRNSIVAPPLPPGAPGSRRGSLAGSLAGTPAGSPSVPFKPFVDSPKGPPRLMFHVGHVLGSQPENGEGKTFEGYSPTEETSNI